jgi:hypothetical protein
MYPQAPKDVQSVLNDFVGLEVPAISFDELVPGDKTAADLLSRVSLIVPIYSSSVFITSHYLYRCCASVLHSARPLAVSTKSYAVTFL